MRLYTRLVTWSVRYRFITVILGLIFFAASLAGASFLPTGFLPATDTARSMLGIELPPGSQLSDTEAVTDTMLIACATDPRLPACSSTADEFQAAPSASARRR